MADITSSNNIDQKVASALDQITTSPANLLNYCVQIPDFNTSVISIYNSFGGNVIKDTTSLISEGAATKVWKQALDQAKSSLETTMRNQDATSQNNQINTNVAPTGSDAPPLQNLSAPFDMRIQRLYQGKDGKNAVITPYDTRFASVSTTGYIVSDKKVQESQIENKDAILKALQSQRLEMANDDFYLGVPSLINTYAITRLYGSKGGQNLVNTKGQRKWYEIDQSSTDTLGFSLVPTTSSIISWGNGDPYGRTPYHFTDFVYSKYWNLVPNNRLITLRRFAAPIVDNMKFPGMDGLVNTGGSSTTVNSNATTDAKDTAADDQGSGKKVDFPPMATAITYFGDETENKLSDILKFSAGLHWGEVQANIFEVNTQSNPDVEKGPAGMFGSLVSVSKMLNIATGNFNQSAILNQGQLPPDPYSNGPYENRVLGPVNRIDTVKKREAGLTYENPIQLNFEYVARPIGGINTKAILLDILSNFLVIGTASAMFWGGQHRFVGQPQRYPFMGGDKGIQQWYRGEPMAWAQTSVKSFASQLTDAGGKIADFASQFFNTLLGKGGGAGGIGGIMDLLSGKNIAGNAIKAYAAEKSKDQIPYLTGLKSLLIGEPVGEWHITIGNPLNPIAMIGNLICTKIEVEFGNELGPDDFPLEIKVKVSLDHGMPRDRDAIESIFNRGMGRMYDLSDDMTGSADYETRVDKVTGNQTKSGSQPTFSGNVIADSTTTGGKNGRAAIKPNALSGAVSVWNREKFASVSPTQDLQLTNDQVMNRSSYRAAEWIALKSLK